MNIRLTGVLSLVLLLGGCGGMRIVDSDVDAVAPAGQALKMPDSYRFERTSLQQTRPQQSAAIEALAEPVLSRFGLRRDDAAAQYAVQVDYLMSFWPRAPWDYPLNSPNRLRPPFPTLGPYGPVLQHVSMPFEPYFPYYEREIVVVVRRLADNQVVFQTRGKHDGRWNDDANILPVMFEAALADFPNPPPGLRRIVIEIPR